MTLPLLRAAAAAALSITLAGCGPEPPPRDGRAAASQTSPAGTAPSPAPAPSQPPVSTAAAAPTPPPPDIPPAIVIHEAELYGSLSARAGKTVKLSVKVITSTTQPEIGNKGTLYQHTGDGQEEAWIAVADVVVKTKLDSTTAISVTITGENKDFGGKKLTPFAPRSRMKLRWEWQ